MPRNPDLQKHTLYLFAGDFEALATYFPDVPTATIVRRLVRKFVEQVEKDPERRSLDARVEIHL